MAGQEQAEIFLHLLFLTQTDQFCEDQTQIPTNTPFVQVFLVRKGTEALIFHYSHNYSPVSEEILATQPQ